MKTIKDLDILSKYLDEDELKDIAKEVAKEAFKNNIGLQNPYRKENIEYYLIRGAFMVLYENMQDASINLQELFNVKIAQAIKKISLYDLQYGNWSNLSQMVNSSLEPHKNAIDFRVAEIIKESYLSATNDYNDKLYTKVFDIVGETVSELINDSLKLKFNEKSN